MTVQTLTLAPGQTLGVISDTHGLLRPEAVAALAGSQLILHGGDIGKPAVLDELAKLAPVVAVRGNVDHDDWAQRIPLTRDLVINGQRLHLLHNIGELDADAARGSQVLVFGHSHKPRNERVDGILHFNPGSAGPRRFRLPVCVGRLWLEADHLQGEIITLQA